jgi:hypothetical protein
MTDLTAERELVPRVFFSRSYGINNLRIAQ